MNIEVVNIGSTFYPKWRLALDGTIVARGTSIADLEPLRRELEETESKAIALRDHCLSVRHTGNYIEIDPLHYILESVKV